jgi:hydroxymethylpyrimidine pyrophosphatase-like HAD family hydrolase
MRFLVLVSDYDETLAVGGAIPPRAVRALERLRASGRRTLLVTGRRLDDLLAVCAQVHLFDYVVAENGALVYAPRTREITLLAQAPPIAFVERLAEVGVEPIDVGHVIVATWLPHHVRVLEVIQEMGLELLIVFNREAVMVLPTGVNKATGAEYALRKLGLSFHEAVGIGNAENDHSFLERCECAVAVANAVPSLGRITAWSTKAAGPDGVVEVIDEIVASDLSRTQGKLPRNLVPIGVRPDAAPVTIPPYGINLLVVGPSDSGKSTITAGIVERLIEQSYQVCIVDPEGDYGTLQDVITIGSPHHPVSLNEALSILEDPKVNLNVNLLGVALADRPEYFGQLFPRLAALRTRTARPHWIVLDEAHHLLPREWGPLPGALPVRLGETLLVTVHPERLPPAILSMIDVVIAVGRRAETTLRRFAEAAGLDPGLPPRIAEASGDIVVWMPRSRDPPFRAFGIPPKRDRIRHRRKYAEGNMRDRSFYFRGPDARHNLRAHNLAIFTQIAEGIDDETWLFHLHRGDYSRWFRDAVKDVYLADQAQRIEQRGNLPSAESRNLIRKLIETRYTLPE